MRNPAFSAATLICPRSLTINRPSRRFTVRNAPKIAGIVTLLTAALLIGYGLFFVQDEPPAGWRSRSIEAGVLRVMQYIEREGDLDSVVRDEFVDRVWKSMKRELALELMYNYKSELGVGEKGEERKMKKGEKEDEEDGEEEGEGENVEGEEEEDGGGKDDVGLSFKGMRRNNVDDAKDYFIQENKDVLKYALEDSNSYKEDVQLLLDALDGKQFSRWLGASKSSSSSSSPSAFSSSVQNMKGKAKTATSSKGLEGFDENKLNKFLSNPILNPFETSYNFNQSAACGVNHQNIDVIIAIPSAPGNFERRRKVRRSDRAKFAKNPKNRAKLLFFLGMPDPLFGEDRAAALQASINEEQNRYGDIVQATFIDSYKNISKKSAQLLQWSSTFCAEAKFVIRTDDDLQVNVSKMVQEMNAQYSKNRHFVMGTMRVGWKPHRRRSSKYFISFEELPHKGHPPFLLGGAMGYPIKTAGLLLEAMRRIPLVWLDDLFLSAICAKRVGVPIFDSSAFQFIHP